MKQTKTQVGLFGIGAIGSVVGAVLHKNNNLSFRYFNRSDRPFLNVIYQNQIESIPISITSTNERAPALDWLIICLKAYDYEAARQQLSKLITPVTKVVVIRNGLHLYESVQGLTTKDQILECLIDCPSQRNKEGYYEQLRTGKLMVPNTFLAEQFAALLVEQEQLSIERIDDFKTAAWRKLIESAALGAILTLSGTTCWIFKDKKLLELYQQLALEGIKVALQDGAKITQNYQEELVIKLKTYPPHKGSSMLSDRLNNRRIELMAKNGIISNLAKQYGVASPLNDLVCNLLKYTNTSPTKF